MGLVFSNYTLGVLSLGAIVAGIWLLVLSGGWTISAAVAIARKARLSKLFIGATIIAFGTSIPELFTSVNANLSGFPGISLGNIVGSNIANVLLVLGAAALFCTLSVKREEIQRDLGFMLLASLVLIGGMIYGLFTFWMGFAMFAVLAGFVFWQYSRNEIDTSEVEEIGEMSGAKAAGLILAGFGGLALGSEILVQGAVTAGVVMGVPEAIIGMTAVAVGTSLPELTTAIAAAVKRETDMIFGNIIGSNTFNILSIVGITAMFRPLEVIPALAGLEMWFMLGVSVVIAVILMASLRLNRLAGMSFLGLYAAFTLFQFRGVLGV
jgi:cation:H+ antiporter